MKKSCIVLFLGLIGCASEHIENSQHIKYLDYAASAHINSEALDDFIRISKLDGNSSGFNLHAQNLKAIERNAGIILANKLNTEGENILFTNSATVSNNIAILGVAKKHPNCHLITTKIEHKSVLNIFKQLEKEGYKVTYLNVDKFGNIDLEQLKKSINKDTKLVSIQMLNSEIGTPQQMEKIGEITSNKHVLFHSDASQAFGKYPIDVEKFHLDFLTVSGYKIGAPKGIACLYIRDRSTLAPILFGSGDELFPGTKATALISAFATAVENYQFDIKSINRNFNALSREIKKISKVHINSKYPSHIFSVSIDGVMLADVLAKIGDYSFSSGCSCLGKGSSNVMEAIDPTGKIPTCTLRISFSDKTSEDELIAFAKKLKIVVEQLRKEKSVSNNCPSDKSDELLSILKKL